MAHPIPWLKSHVLKLPCWRSIFRLDYIFCHFCTLLCIYWIKRWEYYGSSRQISRLDLCDCCNVDYLSETHLKSRQISLTLFVNHTIDMEFCTEHGKALHKLPKWLRYWKGCCGRREFHGDISSIATTPMFSCINLHRICPTQQQVTGDCHKPVSHGKGMLDSLYIIISTTSKKSAQSSCFIRFRGFALAHIFLTKAVVWLSRASKANL